MLQSFHYHQKLCSDLLLKPRGGSLKPRAKIKKCQNFSKSWKTIVQNSINLRVFSKWLFRQ